MKSVIFLLMLVIFVCGCSIGKTITPNESDVGDEARLHVVTTTYAVYEFASEVGGDRVHVFLLPFKRDVGFVEQVDIDALNTADAFIFMGGDYEPWVGDLLSALANDGLQRVDLSESIVFGDAYKVSYYREYVEDEFLGVNLGFWLDFGKDQEIVSVLADELSVLDPDGAVFYADNAASYNQRLNVLGLLYKDRLSKCEHLSDPDKVRQAVVQVYLKSGFDLLGKQDFITMIYENLDLIIEEVGCV